MKVIYIIGPFRGSHSWDVETNVRVAEGMALAVLRLGVAVVCMHSMCRYFTGAVPDETWMKGDLEILRRCDAAITVMGWEGSEFSMTEVLECKKGNVRLFHSLRDLMIWLRGDDA